MKEYYLVSVDFKKLNIEKEAVFRFLEIVNWEKTQKAYFTISLREYSCSRLLTAMIYIPWLNPSIRTLV